MAKSWRMTMHEALADYVEKGMTAPMRIVLEGFVHEVELRMMPKLPKDLEVDKEWMEEIDRIEPGEGSYGDED